MASRSKKRVLEALDDFIVDDEPSHTKKPKTNATQHAKTTRQGASRREDTNGDSYWELSKMRRVTISSFRGKTMVNVREYYEKDGEELPGKKVCF